MVGLLFLAEFHTNLSDCMGFAPGKSYWCAGALWFFRRRQRDSAGRRIFTHYHKALYASTASPRSVCSCWLFIYFFILLWNSYIMYNMKKNVNQLASNLTRSSNSEILKRSLENSRRPSLIIRTSRRTFALTADRLSIRLGIRQHRGLTLTGMQPWSVTDNNDTPLG